ncbi:VanZ family protein [Tepidanaerobacter acetatoxydans]|uniref:VanZ family protein n=1 Tax=Tepidanaerobacter acetatoxydans TaxID=499229 RepID=UPI00350E4775
MPSPDHLFRQVFGNIILFVSMGFLTPLLFREISAFHEIVLVGFISSFTVEFLQFFISFIIGIYRITDIDDIISNIIESVIGFVLFHLYHDLCIKRY